MDSTVVKNAIGSLDELLSKAKDALRDIECRCQRFEGELTKRLVHPLGSCLDILDDDGHRLTGRRRFWQAKVLSSYSIHKACKKSDAASFIKHRDAGHIVIKETFAS